MYLSAILARGRKKQPDYFEQSLSAAIDSNVTVDSDANIGRGMQAKSD